MIKPGAVTPLYKATAMSKRKAERPKHQLYEDAEEVIRGYYVYLHRDNATGEVFYVGKGYGNRAWNSSARNDLWRQRVNELANGWCVELAADQLSEIEAHDLEKRLVTEYGKSFAEGGKLTNLYPGGDGRVSISISINFDDKGWFDEYSKARKFRTFPRAQQEKIVECLTRGLASILKKIDGVRNPPEDGGIVVDDDALSDFEIIADSVCDQAREFLRHRIPWKSFCLSLEEGFDDFEHIRGKHEGGNTATATFWHDCFATISTTLAIVDLGNRAAAVLMADTFVKNAAISKDDRTEGGLNGMRITIG